jgi:hypothetical protein
MEVNHNKRNNRTEHIFELIRKIYPELHLKMVEAIGKENDVYKRTQEQIRKLKKLK